MTNQEINQQISSIIEGMNNRKKILLKEYMGTDFPTDPLIPLSELQSIIQNLDNKIIETGDPGNTYAGLRNYYQNLIDTGQYCLPDTPEFIYSENYRTKQANFVLPQSENDLRDQDQAQIYALVKQVGQ